MKNTSDYLHSCPICLGSEVRLIYDFDDFSVMNCKSCNNSWRTNIYTKDQIAQIYSVDDYVKAPYFSYDKQDIETLCNKRFRNYLRALLRVESLTGIGKLLDVGCGSGYFISIAKERGWDVQGVEISPGLCEKCQRNTGVVISNCSFEEADLQENHYDLITFWDIIEHVIDPVFCIDKAKTLLRPGGNALFCTPNEDSLITTLGWILYKLTGSYYRYPALALHPTVHTYFFSKRGFVKLLQNRGMTVIKSYSQQMHFEDSPAAGRIQKVAIALIEQVGSLLDCCWNLVVLAKL